MCFSATYFVPDCLNLTLVNIWVRTYLKGRKDYHLTVLKSINNFLCDWVVRTTLDRVRKIPKWWVKMVTHHNTPKWSIWQILGSQQRLRCWLHYSTARNNSDWIYCFVNVKLLKWIEFSMIMTILLRKPYTILCARFVTKIGRRRSMTS